MANRKAPLTFGQFIHQGGGQPTEMMKPYSGGKRSTPTRGGFNRAPTAPTVASTVDDAMAATQTAPMDPAATAAAEVARAAPSAPAPGVQTSTAVAGTDTASAAATPSPVTVAPRRRRPPIAGRTSDIIGLGRQYAR